MEFWASLAFSRSARLDNQFNDVDVATSRIEFKKKKKNVDRLVFSNDNNNNIEW